MKTTFIRTAVLMLAATATFANATTGHTTPNPAGSSGSSGAGSGAGGGGGGGGGGAGVAVQGQAQKLEGTQNTTVKGGNTTGVVKGAVTLKDAGNSTSSLTGSGNSKNVNKVTGGTGGTAASKSKAASKSAASVGDGAGAATLTTTGGTFESFGVSWAPIVHGGVATVPSASVAVVPGMCGPLMRTYEQAVQGTIVQSNGEAVPTVIGYKTTAAPLGNWDGAFDGPNYKPFRIANVAGEIVLEGSLVNTFAAVTSTSASVSFSFGLFHKGDAIQAGAAKSDAFQQLVIHERVVPCIYARPAEPITPAQVQTLLPRIDNNGG